MPSTTIGPKRYLLASDFDQTLSFNDSGQILCDIVGIEDFTGKVRDLSAKSMIQQGGELAYLLLHDPDFRHVRVQHLVEAGKQVRLKKNIRGLHELVTSGVRGHVFEFYVISAAPEEVIRSALDGIIPAENIFGTRFNYCPETGAILGINRAVAGYGKVATLSEIRTKRRFIQDHVVYVGDGSSDIHVMLDVNHRNGLTIAVSEAQHIAQIARRTVLCDDALAILIPILEDILRMNSNEISNYLESRGLALQEWTRGRTDWIKFQYDDQNIESYA